MTDILDADILEDNLDFLSRVRLKPHMARIFRALFQEKLQLADLQTDITRVEADLDTETQEVTTLKGNVTAITQTQQATTATLAASAQTISDLNKEVETLKAANPGVDTTSLEAKIAQFEQNNIDLDQQNQTLGGLIPAAPATA